MSQENRYSVLIVRHFSRSDSLDREERSHFHKRVLEWFEETRLAGKNENVDGEIARFENEWALFQRNPKAYTSARTVKSAENEEAVMPPPPESAPAVVTSAAPSQPFNMRMALVSGFSGAAALLLFQTVLQPAACFLGLVGCNAWNTGSNGAVVASAQVGVGIQAPAAALHVASQQASGTRVSDSNVLSDNINPRSNAAGGYGFARLGQLRYRIGADFFDGIRFEGIDEQGQSRQLFRVGRDGRVAFGAQTPDGALTLASGTVFGDDSAIIVPAETGTALSAADRTRGFEALLRLQAVRRQSGGQAIGIGLAGADDTVSRMLARPAGDKQAGVDLVAVLALTVDALQDMGGRLQVLEKANKLAYNSFEIDQETAAAARTSP